MNRLKAEQNPDYASLLLSTGDNTLLELDRHIKKPSSVQPPHTPSRRKPLWAGKLIDGKIYGHNLAGKVLMEVRRKLRQST